MIERPILFRAEMVKQILAGKKTETRRIIDPQPPADRPDIDGYVPHGYSTVKEWPQCRNWWAFRCGADWYTTHQLKPNGEPKIIKCRFGAVGDRLWVRETFTASAYNNSDGSTHWLYKADTVDVFSRRKWKSSMYMPRVASRILLDIVDVRIERLQDITDEGAIAEGIEQLWPIPFWSIGDEYKSTNARKSFCLLWQSIHGRDSWDANPWVFVVKFQKVEQ